MKIVISGYGRMGHQVEKVCVEHKHNIITTIDNADDWKNKTAIIKTADVIIDFSLPETAINVFERCFDLNIPIVTGTTGWYSKMEEIKTLCKSKNASFFYSANFSIGVNIFFEANKKLAKMLSAVGNYSPSMEETHHIHKLDAPSGTAIKAADGIIEVFDGIDKWKNENPTLANELLIISKREGEVIGNHSVIYDSEVDEIKISHKAKNRKGFALGAVVAAEFLKGKKGFFTMKDLLNI